MSDSELNSSIEVSSSERPLSLLVAAVLLTALAGGMAWGIRGQYGHELGAMMFGILAGFTLVLLFMPQASALKAARAVALFTVAIGIGGSMSYGQTVGLTHDREVHTRDGERHWNADAYSWGMLGLAVKEACGSASAERFSAWEWAAGSIRRVK